MRIEIRRTHLCVVHLSGLSNPRPSLSSIAATNPPSDLGLSRGFGHFCVQLLLDAGTSGGRLFARVSASDLQPLVLVRRAAVESECSEVPRWGGVGEGLGIETRERTEFCLEKSGVGRRELNLEVFPSRSKSGDLSAGVKGTSLKGCI